MSRSTQLLKVKVEINLNFKISTEAEKEIRETMGYRDSIKQKFPITDVNLS